MRYNRNENFRYAFNNPIPAYFRITQIDGKSVKTSEGEANLLNLSLGGMKLNSKLDILEIGQKVIQLSVRFFLNGKELICSGMVIWKRGKAETTEYGIRLGDDDQEKHELLEQLKAYSRNAFKNGHVSGD